MDFESFQVKYGYSAPVQKFKGGAKAGIIVAAVLSALATLVVIFMNTIAVLPYYGGGQPLSVTHVLPLIAAALMVIMAGVAKPTNKVVLALPVTVWLVSRGIAAGTSFPALLTAGVAPISLVGNIATLVYTIVVALLMWLCCGGAVKNGTVGGVIITVTAIIGFLVSFVGTFFSILSVIDYNDYMVVVLSANIFADAANMLFYISNAAALFMIGKPKVTPYYPTATQTSAPAQTNNDNTEVK